MKKLIPLFPLKLVVFPSSRYPLHIFEERYKKMIRWCLDNRLGFGIVATIGSSFSNIGTLVIIDEVTRTYPNGESDIVVYGQNRFIVISTHVHKDGYLVAEIETFKDSDEDANGNLISEVKDKFEEILKRAEFSLEENFWRNLDNTKFKSFKFAEKTGLSLEQQQTLLSIQNENKRLTFLLEHLEKLSTFVEETSIIKSLIMNDGFINKINN